MTKREMINEMFDKGYATQYTPKDLEEWFTEEQIERFYNKFMEYLKGVEQTSFFIVKRLTDRGFSVILQSR